MVSVSIVPKMSLTMYKPLPSLPSDVIFEILLCLPPKSLVRFTCVCKPWHNLIKSGHFISQHLAKSASTSHGYILSLYDKPRTNKAFNLLCANTCHYVKQIEIPEELAGPLNSVIVGSFNGIVCLCDTADSAITIRICNPSIGKYRVVRSTSFDVPLESLKDPEIWVGFGFDDETNDYKVIRIVYVPKTNTSGEDSVGEDENNEIQNVDFENETQVEVFSLRHNAWRRVDKVGYFPWQILETASGLVVNRSIHWMACHSYQEGDQLVILSFHLGTHTFREISLPYIRLGLDPNESIGLFQGCLSFFDISAINLFDAECCNLWMMTEYGVAESWTLQYVCVVGGGIERPRYFTKQKKIIVEATGGQLFAFNLETTDMENLEIEDNGGDLTFAPFTQSLLLLGD